MLDGFIPTEEPNYGDLERLVLSGDCVAFVGAGLSIPPCKTWEQSVAHLCQACGCEELAPEELRNPDALKLKADQCRRAKPDRFREAMIELFASDSAETRWGAQYIAQLPFKAILTTNFDLSLLKVPKGLFTSCRGYRDLRLDDFGRERRIYYLHGWVDDKGEHPTDGVVYGWESFERAYGPKSLLPGFLRHVFCYEHVVFLGARLDDNNLHTLLGQAATLCREIQWEQGRRVVPRGRYALLPETGGGQRGSTDHVHPAEEEIARALERCEVRVVRYQPGGEDHLDPTRDPSLAIRSVYGQWFPWLCLLDQGWAEERVNQVFPSAEDQRPLWDAAWDAYIIFCPPYDNVYAVLMPQYRVAIERIGTSPPSRARVADPDEKLAEHLMTFYWRGKLDAEGKAPLLGLFLKYSSDKLRGHALAFVGRSLEETPGPVPEPILARLRTFWESRADAARGSSPAEHKEELAAFGWWFTSGKLDDEWSLVQLEETLRLTGGRIEPDFEVTECLAKLAAQHPGSALNCLRRMVLGDKEGWGVSGWQDAAKSIVATALSSSDAAVKDTAGQLANELGARGHLEFRDLFRK